MTTNHHTAIATGAAANAAVINSPLEELDAAIPGDIGARVYNSANITIPTATQTALTFNSERYDTNGIHSTVTFTGRLTAQIAGRYLIIGSVSWASGTATRQASIRLNGTTSIAFNTNYIASALTLVQPVATIYVLGMGDYVELMVFQNTGGNLDIQSAAQYSPEFMMQLLERT